MTLARTYTSARGFGHSVERGCAAGARGRRLHPRLHGAGFPTGADLTAEGVRHGAAGRRDRAKRRPVIFTLIAFHPSLRDAGAWPTKFPGASALVEGTPAVELDPRLQVGPEDIVVVKKGASAFFGTNLAAILAAQWSTR